MLSITPLDLTQMGDRDMAHTLEQFAAACHDILKAEPGPAGRQKVCTLLQDVLKDETFITTHLGDTVPERKVLYEDAELGFCILAHVYKDAKESPPHDHGPAWAIYGQARGVTEMNDWALVEAASPDKPGKVRKVRTYRLTPGVAFVYNEGDLHSPRRTAPTRLIRIEGMNLDKIQRLRYEPV
jgi:predicted metal-dependent enzyme (double-stranded beta helix superfamily)